MYEDEAESLKWLAMTKYVKSAKSEETYSLYAYRKHMVQSWGQTALAVLRYEVEMSKWVVIKRCQLRTLGAN